MKTLRELVEQYKSDVEQRIKCIQDEWDNADDSVCIDEDCVDDYEQQIAHWEATLKEINDTLGCPQCFTSFCPIGCEMINADKPMDCPHRE